MSDASKKTDAMPEILVCPRTHEPLRREGDFLVTASGVKYPVRDGIPVLLPEAGIGVKREGNLTKLSRGTE